jgi:predicted nucleic-acid-binding Zn-ribbon protein
MTGNCPKCGTNSVVAQDIETLSDSALLVKLEQRIQLTCQDCGWMSFADPIISLRLVGPTLSVV